LPKTGKREAQLCPTGKRWKEERGSDALGGRQLWSITGKRGGKKVDPMWYRKVRNKRKRREIHVIIRRESNEKGKTPCEGGGEGGGLQYYKSKKTALTYEWR